MKNKKSWKNLFRENKTSPQIKTPEKVFQVLEQSLKQVLNLS